MKECTFLFILTISLFYLTACSDNNESEQEILSISEKQLYFKKEGDTQTFSIKFNGQWEMSFNNENTRVKVSPLSGKGDAEIYVEIFENLEDSIFSFSLDIKTSSKCERVKITQEATPTEGYYLPLVTINTEDNKPVDSKDYYLNATYSSLSNCPNLDGEQLYWDLKHLLK